MRWLDLIIDSMDKNLSKLQETMGDRVAWNASDYRITKGQTQLSSWTTANIYPWRTLIPPEKEVWSAVNENILKHGKSEMGFQSYDRWAFLFPVGHTWHPHINRKESFFELLKRTKSSPSLAPFCQKCGDFLSV